MLRYLSKSSRYLFLPILFLWCFNGNVFAQAEQNKFRLGIEGGTFISFTGLNVSLAANASYGDHEFYLGPKWVLSDTYLISRGPWGIDLGYRWNMVQRKRTLGFANVEYQAAFLRPAGNGRKTVVHEIHGAYGLQWRLGNRFQIGNSIGLGGVIENSREPGGATYRLDGFSFLFKLFLTYRFKQRPLKNEG